MKFLHGFDNIKLTTKMAVIAVVMLVGIAIPSFFFIQLTVDSQIAGEIEILGIQPATHAVKLKKLLGEHAAVSIRAVSGDRTLSNALILKGNEIEEQLSSLRQQVMNTGDSILLASFLDVIGSEFKQLQASVNSARLTPNQSFEMHSSILVQADSLVSMILKTYLLSYDPQDASYHLLVANFKDLPRLANSLSNLRSAGASALQLGQISEVQAALIRGFINTIEAPNRDYDYNMSSAAEADVRLVRLKNDSRKIRGQIDSLKQRLEKTVLIKDDFAYSPADFTNEFTNRINDLYRLHDRSLDLLRAIIQDRIDFAKTERNVSIVVVMVLILLAISVGMLINRSIVHSVRKLIAAFEKISRNDYDIAFNVQRKDEMGILESELSSMTEKLKKAAEISLEATKVKQALESSSTCFMMSNAEREIVYMNNSVYALLKRYESEIRKDLPQFNVETIMGSLIDSFNKNLQPQHTMVKQSTKAYEIILELGDASFKLVFNPNRDAQGNDLGNSIEWHDMTEIYEEERRIARILEALDSASTNVMIVNAEREIIYLNRAAQEMLIACESDVRELLPHFSATNVIGKDLDSFHKTSDYQRLPLEMLSAKLESQITVGNRHIRLTINPIFGAQQEQIGAVIEWLDKTEEVLAQREIADIVDASLAGDFSKRVDEMGKTDFLLVLAQGLNELMNTTESGLNEVSKVLLSLSEGDLTKQVTSEYKGTFNDLKNYCNSTTNNLAAIINQIREASDTISIASTEIASGNADLSARTEQQASSLEETASSIEQLTITVRQNSQNAIDANSLSTKATEVAENGGSLIQQVVSTMASINEFSRKMSDIIGVIDGIAFQTNILALNAAVEAARAGEQGRGFAVVASEVRTLAQRSANAAKDIKGLISDSVCQVETGNNLVNQSGQNMQEIVTSIAHVNNLMSEIATASAEQASGIDEVSKAVMQMDEMTQQNAALVEESAATAQSMKSQAADLTARVARFRLGAQDLTTSYSDNRSHKSTARHIQQPSKMVNKKLVTDNLSFISTNRECDEEEWESF